MKPIKAQAGVAFKFLNYRISNFSYNESSVKGNNFDIEFEPSGEYNSITGEYTLKLNFRAFNNDPKFEVITVTAFADYIFDQPYKIEELPKHFYLSAIPIFFPYIRAFISTLTLQTNHENGVMLLGLINFTNMADVLKEKTIAK
ncbi:hypothetical protein FUA48_08380 [Flavobacterium alkalisoli]|uniref:Preprotein translocase subunit SecB n=1 Tax=Flavobacterium alkalisoli TaxID=2602769 RepID=A0A5B9FU41_9FLAO|nr:hypothetical protein [Flavobacterium alkalisoli]QEE49596.1 hypothetical protein FUA48_08380 [Flavobacterium alkalisoli]